MNLYNNVYEPDLNEAIAEACGLDPIAEELTSRCYGPNAKLLQEGVGSWKSKTSSVIIVVGGTLFYRRYYGTVRLLRFPQVVV